MPRRAKRATLSEPFQSLKRDRGGSCSRAEWEMFLLSRRFNPSNGIGVVHAPANGLIRVWLTVFQSLKRDRGGSCLVSLLECTTKTRFNPSNGIGVVHARENWGNQHEGGQFQSLKRDRGGSCLTERRAHSSGTDVSIPQTG